MGRAIVFVFFLIGFVVFTLIRLMVVGTRSAYKAVFEPGQADPELRRAVEECLLLVHLEMQQNYTGAPGELPAAVAQMTLMVQSILLSRGWQVQAETARSIVCEAIVSGGHASSEEIECA